MNVPKKSKADMLVLIENIRALIADAKSKILRTVDSVQVQTYWQIGKHIVEFEQQGEARAEYGKKLIEQLSEKLTKDFGKGFESRNLRHMRLFYQTFPNWYALRTELSWTHYRKLISLANEQARIWYMNTAAEENWSTRTLDRQIGKHYYERLLSSIDKQSVIDEANTKIQPYQTSRDIIRDPLVLEFLGFPESGKYLESDLEQALMDDLQKFMLELGTGFAFVARQKRISTETKDFFIDLVFYNYKIKCFVIIDLKSGELTHQDIGQMDMYVNIFDEKERIKGDNPTVGIILCSDKDESIVRYSSLKNSKQLYATKYMPYLPTEEELRVEIERTKRLLEALKENND